MATDMCTRRLTRELKALQKDPIKSPRIVAMPNEENILEWHYVIEAGPGTPYEGGIYHGKLFFPKEYPLKPPGIVMCTPNGRFQTNRRLCLSMSDYHVETWNPLWSVGTILTGLYSFMVETAPTLGSIDTTFGEKRKLARQSLAYNIKNSKTFCQLFPEYVELYNQKRLEDGGTALSHETSLVNPEQGDMQNLMAVAAALIALVSIVFAFFRFL